MGEEVPAEHLLARVATHDVDALSELYDRYAPRVYGLTAHILPSREAAEEVLEEVFVRLWTESPRLSQEGRSVVAWLVVTAREAAVGRLRAVRRKASRIDPTSHPADTEKASDSRTRKSKGVDLMSAGSKSPKGKAEAPKLRIAPPERAPARDAVPSNWLPEPREITLIEDRLVLLYKAIDQLPQPQRHALELAVFAGLSESEIAAETGEPLGKVQRCLRAGVAFVKHRRRALCGKWAANI